jgi:hypothetical protein
MQWAESIGEYAGTVVQPQFVNKPEHSLQGGKACTQLQALARQYGSARFEKACRCANEILSLTVSSVRSILQCYLDEPADDTFPVQVQLPLHHNVRGAEYFVNGGH